jgi:DNA-binding GntR family transcriptional regulator
MKYTARVHLDLQSQTDIAAGPRYRDLSDWVVLKILDEIRKGTLKSGQRIFEDDLAGQYGMSRAPVRDATHKLERLGVVERRPPRGVFVREWTDADRAEVLKILDALIELSAEEATGHLTDADFAQLEAILDEARHEDGQSVDSTEQARRDARFHLVIAERAGNRRLVELMEQLMLPHTPAAS